MQSSISSVVLVRPGSVTHAFDMDQRLVGLNFTVGNGVLNTTAPPNGSIAPPGYYLLFILNSAGVPSLASFVQLSLAPTDQPPKGVITSPSSDVTIGAGQAVSFSGTGSDSDGTVTGYSWSFPGGSPSSSALANPGSVVYSNARHVRGFVNGDGQCRRLRSQARRQGLLQWSLLTRFQLLQPRKPSNRAEAPAIRSL